MTDIGEYWDETPDDNHIRKADKQAKNGFTQVPNSMIKDTDLSLQARHLYTILLSYGWEKDFAFPSQKTLSKDMGLSERRIRDLLKELEKKGYIEIHRFGFNNPNIYKLLVLPDGKNLDKSFDKIFGEKISNSNGKAKNSRSNRQNPTKAIGNVLPPNNTHDNKHEYSSKKTKKNRKSSFSNIQTTIPGRKR